MASIYVRLLAATLLVATAPTALAQTLVGKPPSTPPPAGQRGFMMVGDRALAFVPAQATPTNPVPLLVLFHGAGRPAQELMKPFLLEADKRGIALLAVQSRGVTWDAVKVYFSSVSQEASLVTRRDRLPGVDRRLVDGAITAFKQAVPIDSKRVGIFGHSDGAAYSLSYGAANTDTISWVGALGPAFAMLPAGARSRGQRIFIAHGKTDDVIPAATSKGTVCPSFLKAGWTIRYETVKAGHEFPPGLEVKMLDDWLRPESRPAPGSAAYKCEGGEGHKGAPARPEDM